MPRTSKKLKILLYDIETSPIIGAVWERYDSRVLWVEQDRKLMSFAYKWLGSSKIHVMARPNCKNPKSDRELAEALWKLMDEADIIIAHNGNKFDKKKVFAKFAEHGLKPPSPFQMVDTYKAARDFFGFSSNRLDDLCETLGLGRKIDTGGNSLWRECMEDLNSLTTPWKRMRRYNKHDVFLLEGLYLVLRPYIENHPNVATLLERPISCPKCGSERLKAKGWKRNRTYSYRRFVCKDCGSHCRSRTRDKAIPATEVV